MRLVVFRRSEPEYYLVTSDFIEDVDLLNLTNVCSTFERIKRIKLIVVFCLCFLFKQVITFL